MQQVYCMHLIVYVFNHGEYLHDLTRELLGQHLLDLTIGKFL